MSNKIVFRAFTDTKKKAPAQQRQKQASTKQEKRTAVPVEESNAQIESQSPVVSNKGEEEKRKKLEEERKALIQKKSEEFKAAMAKEIEDGEERRTKIGVVNGLFELSTLAKVPAYTSSIMNDKTIRYDAILKIPEVAEICTAWTDVVTLVKYCTNLKCIQNNYDSAMVNHQDINLFGCIARIKCQLSGLPEKMSTGDLRMTLGAYPLYINKKPNSTVAQLLFRDGLVKVSTFFKTKTLTTRKLVGGEMKVVSEPFKISTIVLKEEDKRGLYAPVTVPADGGEASYSDSESSDAVPSDE